MCTKSGEKQVDEAPHSRLTPSISTKRVLRMRSNVCSVEEWYPRRAATPSTCARVHTGHGDIGYLRTKIVRLLSLGTSTQNHSPPCRDISATSTGLFFIWTASIVNGRSLKGLKPAQSAESGDQQPCCSLLPDLRLRLLQAIIRWLCSSSPRHGPKAGQRWYNQVVGIPRTANQHVRAPEPVLGVPVRDAVMISPVPDQERGRRERQLLPRQRDPTRCAPTVLLPVRQKQPRSEGGRGAVGRQKPKKTTRKRWRGRRKRMKPQRMHVRNNPPGLMSNQEEHWTAVGRPCKADSKGTRGQLSNRFDQPQTTSCPTSA